jgi:hypothetical protein
MARPLPPLQPPHDGLLPATDEKGRLHERPRNSRRRLVEALRHVAGALWRACCAVLTSAGVIPFEEEPQPASLPASAIEAPDVDAALGGLLYPGCPGAIVRFTAAMAGTHFMANYPWSPERGWVARN